MLRAQGRQGQARGGSYGGSDGEPDDVGFVDLAWDAETANKLLVANSEVVALAVGIVYHSVVSRVGD
jgi:hypothetical protein